MPNKKYIKCLIVDTGGNGLSAAVMLKRAGVEDFTVISRHSDFGGCWFQNRYPGCSSDTKMIYYQFNYAVRSDWPATHASAEDLTEYMKKVARDEGIYPHTDFGIEMLGAEWIEDDARWLVRTNVGDYLAEFLLAATGWLDDVIVPDIPGMKEFKERAFHSAHWPEGYTGACERVAVVGTGSSSLQIVPAVQKVAEKLVVFQRTPNHIIPREFREFSDAELDRYRQNPETYEAEREVLAANTDARWLGNFLGQSRQTMQEAEQLALGHLAAQVSDPVLRAKLTPKHDFVCKRPGSSDDFYLSLQNANVTFVDQAASGFGENSIIAANGEEFEVDAVCFATGFMFGGHILEYIKRRDGVSVAEYQKGHHRAYKSVSVAGCPNLFLIGGPGPNGQIWNGLHPGQAVPAYILKAAEYMEANGIRAIEVREECELVWKREADEFLARSPAAAGTCANYSQDESGHNKAAWPGGLASYDAALAEFVAGDQVAV